MTISYAITATDQEFGQGSIETIFLCLEDHEAEGQIPLKVSQSLMAGS